MKRLSLAIALGASIVALGAAGSAQADPTNDGSRTITLYNCTGPSGTPQTFQITKQPGNVVAFHLIEGNGIYHWVSLMNLTTGEGFTVQGDHDNHPPVTCNITNPFTGDLYEIRGWFTPAA